MKSIKNVYPTITREFIHDTIILAAKGKKKRREVREVLTNIDKYTDLIYTMFVNKEWWQYPTHSREIVERGKKRQLTISRFYPNRILDYIMVEILKPYIRKSMYEYCVGNVNGRGIVYGKKAIEKHYKHYKYALKLDIISFILLYRKNSYKRSYQVK